MTSICRVISCVVEVGVCYDQCIFLAKLICPVLHFALQGQTCLLTRYLLTSSFCIPVPYDEKDIFFWVLGLEDLVSLHRTTQLQLLQHYWLQYILGLLWYGMVCLGNEPRSFGRFWDWTQVLHFGLLLTMRATPCPLKGSLPTVVDIEVIWIKFTHSSPF